MPSLITFYKSYSTKECSFFQEVIETSLKKDSMGKYIWETNVKLKTELKL